MKLTCLGPNLPTSDETIHVHAAGCADIKKNRIYRGALAHGECDTAEYASVQAVVESWFDNQIEESGGDWSEYVGEFRWFPCCSTLPETGA